MNRGASKEKLFSYFFPIVSPWFCFFDQLSHYGLLLQFFIL